MSVWTHVSGSVRIDALLIGGMTDKKVEEVIKEKLGKISTFENWLDTKKIYCTPTGSEGGIHYEYIVTADSDSSMARGAILITAALRDYGEETKEITDIVDWLNKLIDDDSPFFIRQGIVEVQVEGERYHGVAVFSYDDKKFILKDLQAKEETKE